MTVKMSKMLRRLCMVAVGLPVLFASVATVVLAGEPVVVGTSGGEPRISQEGVYSCDFQTELSNRWKMIGGKWERKNGYLTRTDPKPADPTKAIVLLADSPSDMSNNISILAKLRIDSPNEGDWARIGVSACSDPVTAHGIDLVFSGGRLAFVHDYVAWGPSVEFFYRAGTWYWFKLSKRAGLFKGKAWPDGDSEPTQWMTTWEIPDLAIVGYPGLVAGGGGPGPDTREVSFDQCEVLLGDAHLECYTKKSTWHETVAASREAFASQENAVAGHALLRSSLWDLVRRDFSDPAMLRQMAFERRDQIWARDWPFDRPDVLAQRYAEATQANLAPRAHQLAKNVRTISDLEPLRKLYHRSKEIEDILSRWKDSNLQSLRLAVKDLSQTYGDAYPQGPRYLQRIEQIQKAVTDARDAVGGAAELERLSQAVLQFEAIRAEALLANPLLDFDQLLVVKRRDSRSYDPRPTFALPAHSTGPEHLLNGLPLNFQGNGVLRGIPIDNEIAVLSPPRPEGRLSTLFKPERPAFAGDMTLHFDGDRVLFSSIGSHDRFQIFEIGVDGSNLRQVTRGEEVDVDSYDSCYLADDRILFGSSACFQSVPCERRSDEVANFCVMNPDGSGIRRLCFDQDHNFYPTMLSDGRVLYTRWEYADISHAFSARMFTMNPDGTEQRAYYASSSFWPNRIFYAKPIPNHPTKFAGIVTGHHGTARSGELILFDVAKGRRQAEGVVQRIPGRGKKVEAVLEDKLVDESWPKFLHPHPLSDKYFLVSCQPTSRSLWGVYLVDVFDNMVLLREERDWLLFEPTPLRKTSRPKVLPDRIDPDSREATVYLSDIYSGEGLQGIPRGTVEKLRLFTYHFNYFGTSGIEDYVGMDGPWDIRRVLGTVPVAEDGSAYFVVPANTPIAIQPLDSEGKALQLMRSWFTAMPGEAVSCVGCHEGTNSAPPERRPGALAEKPSRIEPWYGPVRGFSWDREVQPVLDEYCVGCHHGGDSPQKRTPMDLRRAEPQPMPHSDALFPPSFYALRRFVRSPGLEGDPRVLPVADYHADTNPLVKMLRKGHHNVRLDAEAWDRLVTWIDMNTPAYGTWMEIPSVGGNPAVAVYRDRRRDLLLRYGGIDEDPEAILDASPTPITALMPLETAPAEPVQVAAWPFDVQEAERRQAAAGDRTEMEIDLGAEVKMRMTLIPAGEFVLGGSAAYADERPLGKAAVRQPFWMGKVEVTNEQFERFDSTHQSGSESMLWLKWSWEDYASLSNAGQPVCRVSWNEAAAFCSWLSQRTGRKFTLPSELQWEWACRAGTDTALNFGPPGADSSSFANLADASLLDFTGWPRTTPFARVELVRQFYATDPVDDKQRVSATAGHYRPNPWGLYDMHGNVSEWTSSAYLPYPFRADDPLHTNPDTRKVVRGGSWFDRADLARSGCRTSYRPWQRIFDVGFRVVCEAD